MQNKMRFFDFIYGSPPCQVSLRLRALRREAHEGCGGRLVSLVEGEMEEG